MTHARCLQCAGDVKIVKRSQQRMEVEKANLQENIHPQISKNQQTTEMESAQGNPEHCGTTKRKQPKNES